MEAFWEASAATQDQKCEKHTLWGWRLKKIDAKACQKSWDRNPGPQMPNPCDGDGALMGALGGPSGSNYKYICLVL